MFYYVDGTVAHTEPGLAVIDCAGVGYACRTSLSTTGSLKTGERARLYTYLHVREDIFELYGFITQEELSCFKLLITVSGVGPKAAVGILSSVTPEQLALAVITEDTKALTAAPGVGKKLAQRVVLELKDKMAKSDIAASGELLPVGAAAGDKAAEAAAALAVLGYSASEAGMAIGGLDVQNLSVEEIVRGALKRIGAK